jgi:hypothetical protein
VAIVGLSPNTVDPGGNNVFIVRAVYIVQVDCQIRASTNGRSKYLDDAMSAQLSILEVGVCGKVDCRSWGGERGGGGWRDNVSDVTRAIADSGVGVSQHER